MKPKAIAPGGNRTHNQPLISRRASRRRDINPLLCQLSYRRLQTLNGICRTDSSVLIRTPRRKRARSVHTARLQNHPHEPQFSRRRVEDRDRWLVRSVQRSRTDTSRLADQRVCSKVRVAVNQDVGRPLEHLTDANMAVDDRDALPVEDDHVARAEADAVRPI